MGLDVLLVDDNVVNRVVAMGMLANIGIVATEASSGIEAEKLCASKYFDIVFMDIQMPERDGIESMNAIKNNVQGYHNVKFVALTAYSMKDDKSKFLKAGFSDYLSKPLTIAKLREVLAVDKHVIPQKTTRQKEPNNKLYAALQEIGVDMLVLSQLNAILDDNALIETYQEFVSESSNLLNGIDFRHLKSVQDIFHTIKGSAGTLGLKELAEMSRKLEQNQAPFTKELQDIINIFPHKLDKIAQILHNLST